MISTTIFNNLNTSYIYDEIHCLYTCICITYSESAIFCKNKFSNTEKKTFKTVGFNQHDIYEIWHYFYLHVPKKKYFIITLSFLGVGGAMNQH